MLTLTIILLTVSCYPIWKFCQFIARPKVPINVFFGRIFPLPDDPNWKGTLNPFARHYTNGDISVEIAGNYSSLGIKDYPYRIANEQKRINKYAEAIRSYWWKKDQIELEKQKIKALEKFDEWTMIRR